jgi:hypothetical protein
VLELRLRLAIIVEAGGVCGEERSYREPGDGMGKICDGIGFSAALSRIRLQRLFSLI